MIISNVMIIVHATVSILLNKTVNCNDNEIERVKICAYTGNKYAST
jgi:hypothetical protein